MKTEAFDYHLPDELIAHRPPERRGESRMMVIDRAANEVRHHRFGEFPAFLQPGDLVVLNDTRVVAARFFSDDGKVELLRTDKLGPLTWKCMVRPGKRMRTGREIAVGGVRGRVQDIADDGERIIEFEAAVDEDATGHLALPPYIGRDDDEADRERYQTVYAKREGAIAAPTAGLHFTPEMLAKLDHTFVTLHVGVGTFKPVKAETIEDHHMHSERYEIGPEAATRIAGADRIVAVGTTVTRVLEHCATEARDEAIQPHAGATDIFIYPPYRFRAVDALLTNFHLPKSTLFMLVSALGGTDLMRHAYEEAIRERYRFYSYGDCMLIV